MNSVQFTISNAAWTKRAKDLRYIRKVVFIQEQSVPVELEWDGLDDDATHFLVENSNGEAIGCARLLNDGQIGRVAVLKRFRKNNIGRQLMLYIIDYARSHSYPNLFLHSQISAVNFYVALGFAKEGSIYKEAGIDHISMKLQENVLAGEANV